MNVLCSGRRAYFAPSLLAAVLGFASVSVSGQVPIIGARSTPVTEATSTLKVGDTAPEFELPDQAGKMVKLSDFRGTKNVVLAFYVLAFTGG